MRIRLSRGNDPLGSHSNVSSLELLSAVTTVSTVTVNAILPDPPFRIEMRSKEQAAKGMSPKKEGSIFGVGPYFAVVAHT